MHWDLKHWKNKMIKKYFTTFNDCYWCVDGGFFIVRYITGLNYIESQAANISKCQKRLTENKLRNN